MRTIEMEGDVYTSPPLTFTISSAFCKITIQSKFRLNSIRSLRVQR